jgi:thiol-disulfide isomerase/thioredoxin
MGVHDFRCSVCGTPGSYKCGEKTGEECEQEGIGEDKAVLDLFFFDADDAPEDASEFEEARERAKRVKTQKFEYDWGEWEFVPSLNYRQLLMDDEDASGIWAIQPYDEDMGDGSPVSIKIAEDERVWVVNYCPPCRKLFAEGKTSASEPCAEYLSSVAEQLGIKFGGARGKVEKAPFIEKVRERVAKRLPAEK